MTISKELLDELLSGVVSYSPILGLNSPWFPSELLPICWTGSGVI